MQQCQEAIVIAIQRQYPLDDHDRKFLANLRQGLNLNDATMRSLEKQVIQSHKQRLQQYEEVFTRAIHQQYPIRTEVRHQLQRLRQSLGLGEDVIKSIEAQVTQTYEQKLQQYHDVFTKAIQRQYPLDNDERFLKDFQQVVDLSQKQVDQADEQRLQQYEAAFTQVIHHQYPISDESRRLLNQLRQNLQLRDTAVESTEAQVTQTYEQELQQYQEIFTRAIQRQYPPSKNDDRFLANLRHSFNLNPKITNSIETLENLRRVLNLNEAVTDSIEARAIETYTSNLSFPVKTLQRGKNPQRVRQLLVKVMVAGIALTSVSLLARVTYIQWWQENQATKAVLDVAETLKAEKKYEACTNQAREIPQQSRFYLEAQTLLDQCQYLAQDEQQLVKAKAFAAQNNFKDAITQANKIQSDDGLRQEAQQLISQWSKPPKQNKAQFEQSSNSAQGSSRLEKESEIATVNQARFSRQKTNSSYRQSTSKVTTATAGEPMITKNSQDKTIKGADSRQSSIQPSYARRSSAQQPTAQRSTTQQSSAKQSYAPRSASQQSSTRRSATQQSATQQSTSQRSGSGGWIVDQE